jgi:stage V sporulation protein SpoVS
MPLLTHLRRVTIAALGAAAILTAAAALASAHTFDANDEAHLHLIHASGSMLTEEGHATGTISGTIKANFDVQATITSTFTIYTHNGSITGHGTGTLHSTSTYSSFGGSLTATSGTGRYKHVHGKGGFYGTVDRNNFAIVVQTTGQLSL